MTDERAGHADERWQLDGEAAGLYQRHLVPAVTAGWAADLVGRVGLRRGELGLQFVPGRSAALAEMRRVLVTGGRIGLTVYGPIEHNPVALALAQALDRHLGPGTSVTKRAEHALADPALLRTLTAGAGFCRVQILTETKIIRFSSAADYVRIQLTATPLASLLRAQAEEAVPHLAQALIADVTAALQARRADGGLAFPQEAHVLLAST
jgi:hypothetical protein